MERAWGPRYLVRRGVWTDRALASVVRRSPGTSARCRPLLPGGDSRGNRRGPEPLLQRQVLTGRADQSRTVNPNSRAAFKPSTLARPASERWPMVRSIASAEWGHVPSWCGWGPVDTWKVIGRLASWIAAHSGSNTGRL